MKKNSQNPQKIKDSMKDDAEYHIVKLKSQVWRHFKRNAEGKCRCNYCGQIFIQLHHSTNQMSSHLNNNHSEQIFGYNRPKNQQQQFITDFIQNLVIEGYPVDKIIDSFLQLLLNYEKQFESLLDRFIGDFPKKKETIKDILKILSIDTDKTVVQQMIKQFIPQLSKGARKSLLQQYFWIFSNQQEIILNFKEHGYDLITLYDDQNLNLMMLVTDSMKLMYSKYGDCLSIDLIDKIFKKKSPYGFSEYSAWFFTGQNSHLDNVLFGFAIINQQNEKNIQFMFDNFFKKMDYVFPISICIPPFMIIQKHLQRIAPQVMIILNWFHKLKFIKQILQNQIQQESIMKTICECFKTPSKSQFNFLIHRILSKVSDQNAIKYGVEKSTEHFCIFNIVPQYIGFSLETSKYLGLEKQVRQIFVYQENIARLFIYAIKLDKKLNSAAYIELQQNSQIQLPQSILQLNKQSNAPYSQFSQNLHSSVLKIKSKQYAISPKVIQRIESSIKQLGIYRVEIVDQITVKVLSKKNHISKWKIFTLVFNVQSNYWICNCKFLYHTGIPCAHLIKVLEHFQGDYIVYLNARWLIPL